MLSGRFQNGVVHVSRVTIDGAMAKKPGPYISAEEGEGIGGKGEGIKRRVTAMSDI